jgi:hypothetical protein
MFYQITEIVGATSIKYTSTMPARYCGEAKIIDFKSRK